MKKILCLLALSVCATVVFAQSDYYVFCDKDGNVYDNDVTITCSNAEVDEFGDAEVPSGLYVKNVDAPSSYTVSAQANITRMDNGNVQLCFPVSCANYRNTGTQTETGKTSLAQGTPKNMQTEWLPTTYGECTVVYSLFTYQTIIKKATRTITVNYKYANPTGITTMNAHSTAVPQTLCDLQGRRTSAGVKGLYLQRMADGSIRKVMRR